MTAEVKDLEPRIKHITVSEGEQASISLFPCNQPDRDDDDDDDIITMADVNWDVSKPRQQSQSAPLTTQAQLRQQDELLWPSSSDGAFRPCNLMQGMKVPMELALCPFKLVQSYPYRFVGRARGEQASLWFKDNIFTNRSWDMFYIHDPYERRDPLILVPTAQFSQLLQEINTELGFSLRIPAKSRNGDIFEIYFGESPRPRFMGKVKDENVYRNAKETLGAILDDLSTLNAGRLHQFKEKMDKIYDSVKSSKSKKDPEKQRLKVINRQKGFGQAIKRVQRYIGLRQRLSLVPYSDATNAGWNVSCKAPFTMDSSVKFVCVDVEANELNTSTITEIGLAILDTEDIEDVPPGERGKSWFPYIEAHHLRIEEYRTIVNSKYIQGCPDEFGFGYSEFIAQKDVCRRLGELIGDSNSKYKSNIVMVGHEAIADLRYLQNLGYNMWNLEKLLDEIDTKEMFQRIQFSPDGRSLEFVCRELGMPGYNFHNAGNDAMYTLRAMIGMAVGKKVGGPMTESEKAGWVFDAKFDDWSDGELDDGGAPVKSAGPSIQMVQPGQPEPVTRAPTGSQS
ncbi:hypothetical protein BKA67DRAFT_658655 [Truncatella angustata]|uniref:Gfd2/YDR514C-like C-terminal domain-containing protein n=1 Tax=Truncatella angustata TaxID=152316 RepID=A0A9P8ZYT4_9PEZI|nr:uncharacterized protein BKA67DRAFT_658655 [Truncatella angustata]KAH6654351.1 hypothetical protein BKA67DRAFT_658655 [Truncatella angustata]